MNKQQNEKEFFFFFSKLAEERFGYHIASLKNGTEVKYTSICENKEYFDRVYNFADRVFVASHKASDITDFEHITIENHNYSMNNSIDKNIEKTQKIEDKQNVDPYTIVQQIKNIRNHEQAFQKDNDIDKITQTVTTKNSFKK